MRARAGRMLGAVAAAISIAVLGGCAGLPTSGDVQSGLPLGVNTDYPDFLPLADDPVEDAGPAEIVEGFMEAAITPADNWATARKFLTPEFAAAWRPATGVSVDASASSRLFTSDVADDADAKNGDQAEVRVLFEQVASVDETGAYSEVIGDATSAYTVVRTGGQWRISGAPNGVVIDQTLFPRVYDDYPLQYFDQTWERLVPDVRWFPRRPTIATTITKALIAGAPSPWLEPAVQSAFPPDVRLARDAVPIDSDQVADVALNIVAAGLDRATLARMRTQLQASLEAAGVRVKQVRFSVDGRTLDAAVVKIDDGGLDSGTLVLKDGEFGNTVGGEVNVIGGVTDEIVGISQPISSIDLAADESRAAVQLSDGRVYIAGDGRLDELDARSALVRPSIDPYGYTWSVPSNKPSAIVAIGADVVPHAVTEAWPGASRVTSIRVSAEGARLAAVVVLGGERWLVVSAIVRDDKGIPVSLGPTKLLRQLSGAVAGIAWLGTYHLSALVDLDDKSVLTQVVGGTGSFVSAPAGAVSVAGSRAISGVRVLGTGGAVFTRSGSAWTTVVDGVSVLATRAGR